MTSRRRGLLVALIPLLGIFATGAVIGPVELLIWLVLATIWAWAFVSWGKQRTRTSLTAESI